MGGWDSFMEHKSEVRCRRGFHSHISLSRKTHSLEAVLQVVAPAKDTKRRGGERNNKGQSKVAGGGETKGEREDKSNSPL